MGKADDRHRLVPDGEQRAARRVEADEQLRAPQAILEALDAAQVGGRDGFGLGGEEVVDGGGVVPDHSERLEAQVGVAHAGGDSGKPLGAAEIVAAGGKAGHEVKELIEALGLGIAEMHRGCLSEEFRRERTETRVPGSRAGAKRAGAEGQRARRTGAGPQASARRTG